MITGKYKCHRESWKQKEIRSLKILSWSEKFICHWTRSDLEATAAALTLCSHNLGDIDSRLFDPVVHFDIIQNLNSFRLLTTVNNILTQVEIN